MKRDGTEAIALPQPQDAKLGLADARGILQHRLKYRLQIAGRSADDAQHLRGCGLLLRRFGKLAPETRVLRFKLGDCLRGLSFTPWEKADWCSPPAPACLKTALAAA